MQIQESQFTSQSNPSKMKLQDRGHQGRIYIQFQIFNVKMCGQKRTLDKATSNFVNFSKTLLYNFDLVIFLIYLYVNFL